MTTKLILALLGMAAILSAAQDPLAEMLRKGVVQEETNQNLDAAIQAYQSVLTQFGEERKTAATALFRLAESYRKQGKNDQAIAAYKRLVQEFSDQTKLAEQSRTVLTREFKVQQQRTVEERRAEEIRELLAKYEERKAQLAAKQALTRQQEAVEAQMKLMQESAQRQFELGAISQDEADKVKLQILQLQRQLAEIEERMARPQR